MTVLWKNTCKPRGVN